eukprot:GEZU01005189.1.p1 GENE.GEZU01005189.1~~GEZU01005189.1.p1  ORF type:complete len:103 (+),score=2.52 GEZU01005189.1:52-360(+)
MIKQGLDWNNGSKRTLAYVLGLIFFAIPPCSAGERKQVCCLQSSRQQLLCCRAQSKDLLELLIYLVTICIPTGSGYLRLVPFSVVAKPQDIETAVLFVQCNK